MPLGASRYYVGLISPITIVKFKVLRSMLINFGGIQVQCRITAKWTQLSLIEGAQVCRLRLSST